MIEVDSRLVLNLFANLSPKKQKKAYRDTLKKGALILLKATRLELKRTGLKGIRKKSRWNTSLNSGIKYKVDKDGKESKVHLMGDFRLKFFEMGTLPRKTKKGYNRGLIEDKYNFFERAKSTKEREIFDNMNNFLSESIQRVSRR